jgi:hypothetical protein
MERGRELESGRVEELKDRRCRTIDLAAILRARVYWYCRLHMLRLFVHR